MKKSSFRLAAIAGFAFITLTPAISIVTQSLPATAQDESCFMVTSSGRRVNLGKLCGYGTLKPSTTNAPGNPAANPNPAATSPNAAANVYQAKIKYRLGKTPVIDVTFNGKQTFEMVVDTGADGTLITGRMASVLRLPMTGVGQFEMADGRTVVMPLARVTSMSVSGAEVRNVEVAVADKTDIGLLGHDFFDNYDVKIKQQVVEFYRR
ncbi:retroviral-like aspartic protease family protein [Kovacikia minuta CCNUW1]|uniref:retropepsin-like aspartic protease family protein n=1 Tax=Kovacikia minuta TaxID=2931930 RepID=UPI001CCD31C9|nr:retropepsin-like aspartic protease [Kovacikia minuta]UBF24957.1 retroviral-like aspartic protease family protein [Kovacikia minuta CCNUW1]